MSEERLNENMVNMETMADYEKEIEESFKRNEDTPVWEKFARLMEEKTPLQVEIAEVVNGGVTAYVDGIRGFIPASKLAASYVENLEEWVGKTIDVLVITVEEERKKLVLSGRELAREKEQEEKKKRVEQCQVGAVMEGTVETIKDYGAFVRLENGLSGLVHVSRISSQRVKHPGAVLKEGQTVKVKIVGIKDGKLSLSIRDAQEKEEEELQQEEFFDYHENGQAATSLGSLLKGLKF